MILLIGVLMVKWVWIVWVECSFWIFFFGILVRWSCFRIFFIWVGVLFVLDNSRNLFCVLIYLGMVILISGVFFFIWLLIVRGYIFLMKLLECVCIMINWYLL